MGTNTSITTKGYWKSRKTKFSCLALEKNETIRYLLTEGKSDKFYEKFINPELLNTRIFVCPINCTEEIKNGEIKEEKNKKRVVEYIKRFIEKEKIAKEIKKKIGKCYGIIDKDFEDNSIFLTQCHGYLICTDYNDLETTLLQYDYSNIEQKFNENIQENKNIIKKAIECANKIGMLRDYCSKNNCKIDFKAIESYDSNYKYNKYFGDNACYNVFVNKKHEFDFQTYMNQTNLKSIKISMEKATTENVEELLECCRGHDIFDFVACFYKKTGKKINPHWNGYKKIQEYRDEAEDFLVSIFNDKDFIAKSPMYKFLCQI